jgi:hypothetical protein
MSETIEDSWRFLGDVIMSSVREVWVMGGRLGIRVERTEGGRINFLRWSI